MAENGNGSRVKSTRVTIVGYGKARTRRWRWSARVWREGKTESEQIRRQGFATEQDARDDADRVLGAMREGKTATAPALPNTITLEAALDRLFAGKARAKAIEETRRQGRHLMAAFGKDTTLDRITASVISSYRAARLNTPVERTGLPRTAAAINRPLALLRHLLRVAHQEWELAPAPPNIRMEKEPEGRLRYLDREKGEDVRLLTETTKSGNPDLHDLVILSIYTGLRRSEALGLTWERVDRARGVLLISASKSGRRREVPFGVQVEEVFARRAGTSGNVFRSKNWNSYRSAFERAVEDAKLEDFTWHDLRHTYGSWLAMAGRPLLDISKLMGHSTLKMTMRYAHLSPGHLRSAVAVLDNVKIEVPAPTSKKKSPVVA